MRKCCRVSVMRRTRFCATRLRPDYRHFSTLEAPDPIVLLKMVLMSADGKDLKRRGRRAVGQNNVCSGTKRGLVYTTHTWLREC
jgi:hypothetical protein